MAWRSASIDKPLNRERHETEDSCGMASQIGGYTGELYPAEFSAVDRGANPPQVATQLSRA